MSKETYTRQAALNLKIPQIVMIVGIGGIGSWVALGLAIDGCPELILADSDIIEESNRGRVPVPPSAVGKLKTEAIATEINRLRPATLVTQLGAVTETVLDAMPTLDLIWDCTDRDSIQRLLYTTCRAKKIPYIRTGYDGTHITVASKVSGWALTSVADQHNYTVIPSACFPCMTVAGLGLAKALKFSTLEVCADISKLGVQE